MRKTIFALAMTAVIASCSNNKAGTELNKNTVADTISSSLTDRNRVLQTEGVNDTVITTVIIPKEPVVEAPKVAVAKPKSTGTQKTTTTKKTTTSTGGGSGTSTETTSTTTQKKKGWSSAAKGTAIGAGSGAVLGAVVSKKKGKGAIIGGVVGAASGYIIGNEMDKKSGRKQKN